MIRKGVRFYELSLVRLIRTELIILPLLLQGPRVKLLNSTRQLYTSDTQEFSPVPSGPPPSSRPVGRNAGWSPQGGIIPTSSTPTTVAAAVPYGAKRVPGRKVDPNKKVSEGQETVNRNIYLRGVPPCVVLRRRNILCNVLEVWDLIYATSIVRFYPESELANNERILSNWHQSRIFSG